MKDFLKILSSSQSDDSMYTSWNITHLSYTAYDPEMFWETVGIKKLGLPVPPKFDSNYARAIAICTIQEIDRKWSEPDEGKSTYQRDVLNETVKNVAKYYGKNPDSFFRMCPKKPMTKALKERQHLVIRGMAKKRIKSAPGKLYREIEKDKRNRIYLNDNDESGKARTQEEMIEVAYHNSNYDLDRSEWTDLDTHIISTSLDQATITDESIDIISQYFLNNPQQIQAIVPYFQNKVLVGLNPKNLWKVNVFEWKASEVYTLLENMDIGVPILPNEKGYLYMFYLMVCIAALQQKWKTSVQAISDASMIIGRQHIPTLTTLVIKTFLHFTKDLEKNVFSHFELPPPIKPSEITAFSNLIKDKPRNILKSIPVPLASVPKPPKKKTVVKMVKNASGDSLPPVFNFAEAFESYEVFETLTNNIVASFMEGKIIESENPSNQKSSDNLPEIQERVLLVRLPKLSVDASDKMILEAVAGPWRVSKEKLEKVEYIIPIVSGVAQDVCRLDKIAPDQSGRWSCSCSMADSAIRNKYKGMDFSPLFPRGTANPVKYLNV
jgi:hypothetical protein